MRSSWVAIAIVHSLALAVTSSANAQEPVNWTGSYALVFGQYTRGSSSQNDNGFVYKPPAKKTAAAPAPPAGCPPGFIDLGGGICVPAGGDGGVGIADGNYGLSGGFGGGGIGYNYQTLWLVMGIEGTIGGGRASGSSSYCGNPFHECGTSINAVSEVRARLGYAYGRLLPFIAGGLAVDHLHAYDSLFGVSGSAWRAGYVVGGGLEYKLSPRWSARAEYLHTEIGASHLFDIVPGVPERIKARTDSARLCLVYSFEQVAAPVVAKY